jgi:phosphonate transport system substrate-binding protein
MITMKQKTTTITFLLGLFLSYALTATAATPLKLSMLPLYSTDEISQQLTPLAALLSKATATQVEPLLVSNFKEYEQRLSRDIDISYQNPVVYVQSGSKHEAIAVILKEPDGSKFRGIIITRADSPIVNVEDLKGKRVAIVGPTSTGGFLSQRLTLLQQGIDTSRDMIIEEALNNKQENVILSVYNGDVDAGFIRESALHQVDNYVPSNQIRIIKKTAFLPEWVISVNRSLPAKTKAEIRNALIELKSGDPLLKTMKIQAFETAEDHDYDSVRHAMGLPIPAR